MKRLILTAVISFIGSTAIAQTCETPPIPQCLQSTAPFVDRDDAQSCQGELNTYRTDVHAFATCLRARAAEVQQNTLGLAKKFRCRAGNAEACE